MVSRLVLPFGKRGSGTKGNGREVMLGEKLVGSIETHNFDCDDCRGLLKRIKGDDLSKPQPRVRTVHPPKVIGEYEVKGFGVVTRWCLGGTKGKWIVYGGPEELDIWESLGEETTE